MVTNVEIGLFQGFSHAIVYYTAQMRRAVCQRQLRFFIALL